jgi:hypothetical protein
VRKASLRVDDQEPGIQRPLNGLIGGNHVRASSPAVETGG